MTTTHIPPVVSTRIDISDQPVTRTALMDLFIASEDTEYARAEARRVRFSTLTPTAEQLDEYRTARITAQSARQAMIDAIYALKGIPA